MIARRELLAGLAALPLAGPARGEDGGIDRHDPALDRLIPPGAQVEVLGRGYGWAEGPVWMPGGYLLFSDVPGNTIHRWDAERGVTVFRRPSGLAQPTPAVREGGANGLAVDTRGRLIYADSGNRAIMRLSLASGRRKILADRFEGKRFNSPNDLVIARSGAIYFTDPPYGLAGMDASPAREMAFCGLYRLDPDGTVRALDRTIVWPNGVALSPDERTLYLAMSDPKRPEVLAYALDPAGMPTGVRRFADFRGVTGPGLPDGLKTDAKGRVFATGPGGVHVLTPEGRMLGVVSTGKAIANCAIGDGGRWLFLTSHDLLARVALRPGA